MWLLEQSRREWSADRHTYAELDTLVLREEPFFSSPGDPDVAPLAGLESPYHVSDSGEDSFRTAWYDMP